MIMKQPSLFSILLFTFVLLLLSPNLTQGLIPGEATEIPYQINKSDHIVIGTVSEIIEFNDHTIATITVNKWLYNPLPSKTIKVRTEIGTNLRTEDEAEFTHNESVLLMLQDTDLKKQLFHVTFGDLGKHPVSDEGKVIEVLKAQGKWTGEDQIGNKTNVTETVNKTEITNSQKENITENMTVTDGKAENTVTLGNQGESNTTQKSNKSNSTPFISPIWILVTVVMAAVYFRKIKK